jgi:hypothetical protein
MEPEGDTEVEVPTLDPADPVDIAGPLTLSHSQVELFRQCPYRWWLLKRKQVSRAPSEALILGQGVHHAIEADLHPRLSGEPPADLPTLTEYLLSALTQQLAQEDPGELITPARRLWLEQQGRAVLQAYVRFSPRVHPVAVEREFLFTHPQDATVSFAGRIDAITEPEDGTQERTIVDWKVTGRRWPPGEEAHRIQAPAYLWAERCMTWSRSARVTFVTFPPKRLGTGSAHEAVPERVVDARPTHPSEDQINRYATLVLSTASSIRAMDARGNFPVHLSPLCGWCEVRGACARGQEYVANERIVERVPAIAEARAIVPESDKPSQII